MPQYRLRDIKDSRLKNILRDVLVAYVGFFKLKRWFDRWKGANPGLAAQLGLGPDRSAIYDKPGAEGLPLVARSLA